MRPAVKALYGFGLFLLIGSPLGFVIGTLVQAPSSEGHSGLGPVLTKLIVASFASLPFMTLGAILLIIGYVINRRAKTH